MSVAVAPAGAVGMRSLHRRYICAGPLLIVFFTVPAGTVEKSHCNSRVKYT